MMTYRNFGALLALGALTALPACSMFGGGGGGEQYSSTQSHYASTAPSGYATSGSSGAYGTSNQAASNETVVPTTKAMVRKVQTALKDSNEYNARVDGVWGPATEHGVRQWQQSHNLTVNGKLDMATLQSMNISAGNENNAANSSYDNDRGNGSNQATSGNNGSYQPSNNAANNGAQPMGSQNGQNYSTAGSRQNGSSYTSNNPNASSNTPYPTNQGNMNNGANNVTNNGSNTNGAAPTH